MSRTNNMLQLLVLALIALLNYGLAFRVCSSRGMRGIAARACANDFCLIRRLEKDKGSHIHVSPTETDQRHVGIVVTLPSTESDLAEMDTVFLQDPWGIGPRDYTDKGERYSYVKIDRIIGRVRM